MNKYQIHSYSKNFYESYKRFVNRNFKNPYQAKKRYIEWLYIQNPSAKSFDNFRIVTFDKDVVGCMHNLETNIYCKSSSEIIRISAIHNLMVDKNHRQGIGFLLIRDVLIRNKSFIVPGATGKLAESYKNLGSKSLYSYWVQKSLKPNPFDFYSLLTISSSKFCEYVLKKYKNYENYFELNFNFDKNLLNIINDNSGYALDSDFIKWRFFSSHSSYIVLNSKSSYVIVVIGYKYHMPIARIIYSSFSNVDNLNFMSNIIRFINNLGCVHILSTITDLSNVSYFDDMGFRKRVLQPSSMIYSKTLDHNKLTNWPIVSDLGFDENFSWR